MAKNPPWTRSSALRPSALLAGIVLLTSLLPSAVQAEEFVVAIRNPAGVFVQSGEQGLHGYDIDLLDSFVSWHAVRFGEALEVRREMVESIDELLELTVEGDCDLAVGSITITDERAERVDFSASYLPVRMVLFAKKGRIDEGPYQSTLVGKTLGGLAGSTAESRMGELQQEVGDLTTKTYADYDSLFAALLDPQPEIDGVVTDVTHYWVLSGREELTMVAPMSEQQGLGFVLPKGSPLKERIDVFLDEYSHTSAYFQLVRRYFGKEAADMLLFSKAGGS